MRFFHAFINFFKLVSNKNYSTLSGAIAFFLVANCGSIAYLTIFISKLLNVDIPFINLEIFKFFDFVELSYADNNYLYTIFFICTSVIGASTMFFHLLKTGEMIYDEENGRFTIFKRLTAIVFLAAFLIIIETFIIIFTLSKGLLNNLLWQIIKYALFAFVPLLIAVCINFFITPHKVKISEILTGSIITTFSWYLVTILFTIFINIFKNFKAIYGAITVFVVFMVWVYLLAQGLVIGVIINEKTKTVNLLKEALVNNNSGTQKEVYEKI